MAQQVRAWGRAGCPVDANGNPVAPGTAGAVPCPYLTGGTIDLASVVESSPGSGLWKAYAATISGTTTAAGANVVDASRTFVDSDANDTAVRILTGANAGLVRVQFWVGDPHSPGNTGFPSPIELGARYEIVPIATSDGTHKTRRSTAEATAFLVGQLARVKAG